MGNKGAKKKSHNASKPAKGAPASDVADRPTDAIATSPPDGPETFDTLFRDRLPFISSKSDYQDLKKRIETFLEVEEKAGQKLLSTVRALLSLLEDRSITSLDRRSCQRRARNYRKDVPRSQGRQTPPEPSFDRNIGRGQQNVYCSSGLSSSRMAVCLFRHVIEAEARPAGRACLAGRNSGNCGLRSRLIAVLPSLKSGSTR